MKRYVHVVILSSALAVGFVGGAGAQAKREAHPVLEQAIQQIDAIRGRLQKAPQDFGGHRVKAVEALKLATDELHEALRFDK